MIEKMNKIKWNKQMTKTLFMTLILLMFGSTYFIIDYKSISTREEKMWNGEFELITDKKFDNPDKTLSINLGDGFISNIESIFIHLSLLFGAFRLVDFLFLFNPKFKSEIDIKEKFRKIINRIKNKDNMEN